MTNFDKIKAMDVEELTNVLDTQEGKCEFCAWYVRETESLNCIALLPTKEHEDEKIIEGLTNYLKAMEAQVERQFLEEELYHQQNNASDQAVIAYPRER